MAVGLCWAPATAASELAGAGLWGVGSAEQHGFPFPRLRRGDTDHLFRNESWAASRVCDRCRCNVLRPVQSQKRCTERASLPCVAAVPVVLAVRGGGVAPPSAPGALWGGEVPLPLPTTPPPELSASPSTVPKAGVPESAGKSSPGCGPQARVPTGPDTILSGGIFGFEVEVFVRTQQRPNLETSGLIFTQRFADGERGPGLSVMQNPHVHSEDAVSHQATPLPRVQETPRERPLR